MNCPSCGFNSPPEMLFCGACGTRLRSACAACGFANPFDYRFCGMCGTRLSPEAGLTVNAQPLPLPNPEAVQPTVVNPLPLEGERRIVTVIITDLTDSTVLLERVGTEGWVDLMNRILHILESEINRFGGNVSQFRGDGLVAFFGAPVAHEDDPERAVLAALAMQNAFIHYVQEIAQPEARELKMRVGVNTGEVIVAHAGGRQQWEETAMGAAVTLAARMETSAEPGTVLVSEHTYSLVKPLFNWQAVGEITVKGVSQQLAVYRPLAPVADAQAQTFTSFLARVGRNDEFHSIKKCIEDVLAGRGRIILLAGDKGSGKSFLMGEVYRYFAHRDSLLAETHQAHIAPAPELIWVRGRCRSYSQTWPYSIWQDLFRDWLGFRPDTSKEAQRIDLRTQAEIFWGAEVNEHYPYLAMFLGLPLEPVYDEKIKHLNAEGLRQRFFLAVRAWIEAAARQAPVVLTFADMQWADDSSLALMKYCLPVCDSEALLCVFTYRPERDLPILNFQHYLEAEYPHRLTSVHLGPLTEAQSQALIAQLIGAGVLPTETCQLILQMAAGNPYYILELMRGLIAKGILARADEHSAWHLTRTVTTLDLPDNLQRLLLAHIDRLSAQERLVLQLAAVIGPVFWQNMLQALLDEIPTLKLDLAALQRNQFILESGRVPELGMQYTFKSPLIRDTAYESMLHAQRVLYHGRAAAYLENLIGPGELASYDGMLAYHYRGAGQTKKELFYTFLAAERARMIYANIEALQHYDRAVVLLELLKAEFDSDEQKHSLLTQCFEVLMGRRAVLLDLGDIAAARADTLALLPLAEQLADDRTWLIDALLAQADFPANTRDELRPGLQMAEQALNLARAVGDRRRELFSLISVASLRLVLRESSALEMALEALALARDLGDLRTEVNILLGIGNAYGMDDLPRSREYLEAALARSETLNDKKIEILLLEALGRQFERDGDYYRQLTEYELKRLQLSREIGNRYVEGQALMFCGQIQALYLGDYEAGFEMEKRVQQIWESITGRLFPLLRMAQIQIVRGQLEAATATLASARPLADKVVMEIGRAGLNLVAVMLYSALGDETHLWEALDLVSQLQQMTSDNLVSQQYRMAAACEASGVRLQLARYLADRGADDREQITQALADSQAALDLYQHFGFVQIVECTSEEILYRHAVALTANGQTTAAVEFLRRAYNEMRRKHAMIPTESPFYKTFLDIPLHRIILQAQATQAK